MVAYQASSSVFDHDTQMDWLRCFADAASSREAFAQMRTETLEAFGPLLHEMLHDLGAVPPGCDPAVLRRWQKIVRRELQRRRVPS